MNFLERICNRVSPYVPIYLKQNKYLNKIYTSSFPYIQWLFFKILYVYTSIQIYYNSICPQPDGFIKMSLFNINQAKYIESNSQIEKILSNSNRNDVFILKFMFKHKVGRKIIYPERNYPQECISHTINDSALSVTLNSISDDRGKEQDITELFNEYLIFNNYCDIKFRYLINDSGEFFFKATDELKLIEKSITSHRFIIHDEFNL